MDVTDYFTASVSNQSVTVEVWRNGGNSYDDDFSKVDEIQVSISDVSSQSETTVEGSDESVNYKGLLNPQYDTNGDLTEVIFVNDQLRLKDSPKSYIVKTKSGRPNDIDPDMWQLGLDRANSSQ